MRGPTVKLTAGKGKKARATWGNKGKRLQLRLREPQVCEFSECEVVFRPNKSTRRYCGATCRQRAKRARNGAAAARLTIMDALGAALASDGGESGAEA